MEEKLISVTTAAQFADALENWIIDNKCNPTTQEEWDRCIQDLLTSGALTPVGVLKGEDVKEFKDTLKENLNVKEL